MLSKPKLGKDASIKNALTRVSVKVSSKKHSQFKAPAKRGELPANTTRMKLNVSGNRRGMNMVEAPPTSEEMKRRRAMRQLWNKRMPSLHCSNCQFSAQCPQFKAGYECAFLPFINSHSIESEADLIFYAKELCGENIRRAQVMLIMERLSGAKPDLDTSEALSHTFQQLMSLHERLTDKGDASIEVESTDGTIIGRLFGSLGNLMGQTEDAYSNPIDIPSSAGEAMLDEKPALPQSVEDGVMSAPQRIPDASLMKELSEFKGAPIVAPIGNKKPIQEEL